MKLLENKKVYILSVLFLFLFAFILRIYKIDQLSFWRDEGVTIFLAQQNLSEMLRMTAADTNAPLIQLLLHFWLEIFNLNELSARLLPLLFSIGILVYVYLISKKHFSKLDTLYILLLNSVLFISIFFAREVRAYSLLAFLLLGGFYHGLQYVKSLKFSHAILFIFLNSLAFYTHNTSIVFIFIEAIYLFYLLFPKFDIKLIRQKIWKYILLYLGILLLSLPWLIIFVKQAALVDSSFWLGFDPIDSVNETVTGLVTGIRLFTHEKFDIFDALHNWVSIVFLISGTIYELNNFKKQKIHYSLIFWSVFVILFILSFAKPLLYMRYVYFLVPFMIFTIFKGIKSISRKKVFILVMVVILSVLNLITYTKYIKNDYSKADYRSAAEYIIRASGKDSQIVHLDALSFFSFEIYSEDKIQNTIYDPEDVTPYYVGKSMTYEFDYNRSIDEFSDRDSLWLVKLGAINDTDLADFEEDFSFIKGKSFRGGLEVQLWENTHK